MLLVWWLEGRRERERDRKSLIGAIELVASELAYNITQAHIWAVLGDQPSAATDGGAPPIRMRSLLWEANAGELARALPRDLAAKIALVQHQLIIFNTNIAAAAARGHVVDADMKLAAYNRDLMQTVLRQLQGFERKHLGVTFDVEPIGPTEVDDSPWGTPEARWDDAPQIQASRSAWQRSSCPGCRTPVDPIRDSRHEVFEPGKAEPYELLLKHSKCGLHFRVRLV